jgi:peptidoglycan/xylan/chitin deacetylase (PgdA/CDA1 family)
MPSNMNGSATGVGRTDPAVPSPRRRALALTLLCAPVVGTQASRPSASQVPILVFHRLADEALDSMTVRTATFRAQLRMLQELSCQVISLLSWVEWRLAVARGDAATLPPHAVVLTADDGHRSQFEVMAPLLRELGWPVTLFVYPSAISNAGYAMTWPQLRELAADPLVSVQSHTYWHPNLLRERERLPPAAFHRFAADQLTRSREKLQSHLDRPVTLLAWPFGQGDDALAQQASQAGYAAAFSLGNRSASAVDSLYAVPRHLIVDVIDARQLAARLDAAFSARSRP